MVAKARAALPAVVAAYDFGAFETIVDVGGGRGHLLELVLAGAPHAEGVLFELPHVIADALAVPRMKLVAGDIFRDALPSADAYLLMDVLHDWADTDVARILHAVRAAARPTARVLIIETLVAETPGPHFGKLVDVIMLAATGGRERTPSQLAALLTSAGFKLQRLVPTSAQHSIVEAVAV
jgi:hypothetical protein